MMEICPKYQQARQCLPINGAAPHTPRGAAQDNSGDHAGSEAKPGVGTRYSLRPGNIDGEQRRSAIAAGIAEEHHDPAIRRKGRPFIVEA